MTSPDRRLEGEEARSDAEPKNFGLELASRPGSSFSPDEDPSYPICFWFRKRVQQKSFVALPCPQSPCWQRRSSCVSQQTISGNFDAHGESLLVLAREVIKVEAEATSRLDLVSHPTCLLFQPGSPARQAAQLRFLERFRRAPQ